jgi:hypothetical protein
MTGKRNRGRTAQPQNEILCSKGAWGIPNKQRQEPNGYPGALLATLSRTLGQPTHFGALGYLSDTASFPHTPRKDTLTLEKRCAIIPLV